MSHSTRTARNVARIVACVALAACTSAPPPPPGLGAIEGKVRAAPKKGAPEPSSYEQQSAAPRRIDYERLDGIVVWLEGPGTSSEATKPTLKLGDKGFEPYVVALGEGGTLVVENASKEPATIYALDGFDAGTLAPGKTAEVTVKKSGPLQVVVEERDAQAWVFVAPTSRVTVLKSGNAFRWNALSPGAYTVHAWHWRLPPSETRVAVTADKTTDAELTVSVNELPKAN